MKKVLDFHDTLVLVYGMACPLKCDFCCHPVEEYKAIKMKPEEAIGWIRQAARIPSFQLVVFTGGEPFVYYRDLLRILDATFDTGLPFRIVTAAPFARSVEEAKAKLLPLKERGLRELSVSTDPSHQVFVPASFAENAVRAAVELGLAAELAGVFWDPLTKVEDVVRVPEGVRTVRHLAVPIGRGKERQVTPEAYKLDLGRFRGCGRSRTYDLTIYPDGEVYPCCSGGFNIQAKLSFGNARREPLEVIVERIHADRYVSLVFEQGFWLLYELCRFKCPDLFQKLPDWSPYVSPCQLCARIHSDQGLMEALAPLLQYADRLAKAIEALMPEAASSKESIPRG